MNPEFSNDTYEREWVGRKESQERSNGRDWDVDEKLSSG